MPAYDMYCETCDTTTEVHCPMADRDTQVCTKCNKLLVQSYTAISHYWNCEWPGGYKGTLGKDKT